MSADREEVTDDGIEEGGAPSRKLALQKIRRKPASKRSVVNEFQSRLLTMLIERLEAAALRHFGAPGPERLPAERHKEFTALEDYRLFIEGAYACGFVCADFSPDFPIDVANAQPEETVASWSFFQLRHFVHTLLRSERWADGYSSPIFEALTRGVLQSIGRRLASDDTLVEPN